MDEFATHHFRQGWDSTYNCQYTISVSPLSGQQSYAHELNVDVKYEYLSALNLISHSNPDISRWELQITGEPYPGFEQDLGLRLHDEGVPLAIQNDIVPLIANHVSTRVYIGLYACIEIHIFDYEYEDEELEKVTIKGGERETSCAVCLDEFPLGLETTKLPCSHLFHGGCLARWLQRRGVCPLCRYELSSAKHA